jgi:hypothetical protein
VTQEGFLELLECSCLSYTLASQLMPFIYDQHFQDAPNFLPQLNIYRPPLTTTTAFDLRVRPFIQLSKP